MWKSERLGEWVSETHVITVNHNGKFLIHSKPFARKTIHDTLQEAKDSIKPEVRPWTHQEACAAFGERGFDLSDGSKVLSLEVAEVLVLRPSGNGCYYSYLKMSKEHTFPGGTPCGFVENP